MGEKKHLEVSSSRQHATAAYQFEDSCLVDWDSDQDPELPLNWSAPRRWLCMGIISGMTFVIGMASSILSPVVPIIMDELHSDNENLAIIVISIFVLGFAFGPLIAAPISESHGRLMVYNVSNILFLVFNIACAVSSNMGMLVGFRFLAGCVGGTPMAIGGGTIHDLIRREKRGMAMGIFGGGLLIGPIVGPVIAGYMVDALDWRWIFWLLAIVSGTVTVTTALCMRETSATAILRRKTRRLQKSTGNYSLRPINDSGLSTKVLLYRSIVRPTRMLLLSPVVSLLSIFLAINYGYLYLLFATLTTTFQNNYRFSTSSTGLAYLGLGVGSFIGLVGISLLSDRLAQQRLAQGRYKPEHRLIPMIIGTPFLPIGLLWYGWSAEAQVHWILPIMGTAFFGVGMVSTLIPTMAYLVDAFTDYAASALAAATVLRAVTGAILPLAAPQMYARLGLGWGNSLLAFISLAMLPVPGLFYFYAERLRLKTPK